MKRIHFIGLFLLFPTLLQAANLPSIDSSRRLQDSTRNKAKVSSLIKLSEQNRNKSVYDCKQYFQKAFDLAKNNNFKNLMGLSSKSMGVSYYYWGDMKNAFRYFKKGLYYYRLSDYKKGQSNCLNDIGLVYEEWANFDSAAYYYKASYLIEKTLNHTEGEATSLINMGNIEYYRKNYHGALENFFHALKEFIQIGDKNGMAMSYSSVGIIYTQIGEYDKALRYLEKAKELFSGTGNIRKLSRVLNNMADIYSDHFMEYKKAKILYQKVLKIKTELSDKEGIALVKNNFGVLYGHMGNLSLALRYFDESRSIYEETGDKTGISMVYQSRGNALQNAGLYRQALKEFQKSLAISSKVGLKSYTHNNYLGIFKCYAALGEYNNFNKYYTLFEQGRDTVMENLEKIRASKLETQFKIDTLVRQRNRLKEESRRKGIKVQQFTALSIGLFLVIIILILMFILFKRAKKETKKYNVND